MAVVVAGEADGDHAAAGETVYGHTARSAVLGYSAERSACRFWLRPRIGPLTLRFYWGIVVLLLAHIAGVIVYILLA